MTEMVERVARAARSSISCNVRYVVTERHGVCGCVEWFGYRGQKFPSEEAAFAAARDLPPVLEAVETALGKETP